jgi:hypothetical protein
MNRNALVILLLALMLLTWGVIHWVSAAVPTSLLDVRESQAAMAESAAPGSSAAPLQPGVPAERLQPGVPAERLPVPTVSKPLGLRVRVLQLNQQPVAGASVEARGEFDQLQFPLTDAEGYACATRFPEGRVMLHARLGRLAGAASWGWTASLYREVVLWVLPEREVRITVRDVDGRTVPGIAVGVCAPKQAWRSIPAALQAVTDASGSAQIVLRGANGGLSTAKLVEAVANAAANSSGSLVRSAPIVWQADGRAEVELQLAAPTSGLQESVVTVRFLGPSGAPAEVAGILHWSREIARQGGSSTWGGGSLEVRGTSARLMGLGDVDEVHLHLEEEGRLESRLEASIPMGAAASEVTMIRGQASPQLEIPLVDELGRPVTAGPFQLYASQPNQRFGMGMEVTCEPSEQGLLRLPLSIVGGGKIEIACQRRADRLFLSTEKGLKRPYNSFGQIETDNPVVAVRTFASVAAGEVRRLDPVVVPSMREVVRGRVVDREGKPAARVRILMTTATQPEPAAMKDFETRTDADGAFAILSAEALPAGTMLCGRRVSGYCPPVPVPGNGEPVQLTLLPSGALELRMRRPLGLDDMIGAQQYSRSSAGFSLFVDLQQFEPGWSAFFRAGAGSGLGDARGRWHATSYMRGDSPLAYDDLIPATYQLRGFIGLNPVLSVDGIVVVAGETSRPDALQDRTLGADLQHTCVRVRDSDGSPVAGANVRFQLPSWQSTLPNGANAQTDEKGEAWFVMPRGSVVDLEVVSQGRAPTKVPGAVLPIDVTMGVGTSFDVMLAGHELLGDWVRSLVVAATAHDGVTPSAPIVRFGSFSQVKHPSVPVDMSSGKAKIANLVPGRYRLWVAAYPPIMPHAGRSNQDICFVSLGDFVVASGGPAVVPVEHELTPMEIVQLQVR